MLYLPAIRFIALVLVLLFIEGDHPSSAFILLKFLVKFVLVGWEGAEGVAKLSFKKSK